MNNPKTRQQWILEGLKFNPSISFVEMFSKYFVEFSKSEVTFSKDWNKANEDLKEYQKIINNVKLEESISLEKESLKRNILSKHDALEILTEIAQGKTDEVDGKLVKPSFADRRNAIDSLAKFEGWNAPTKIENTGATKLIIKGKKYAGKAINNDSSN